MNHYTYETIKTRDSLFVIIEGKEVLSLAEFYKTLETALVFPDYFGHNLDALYDMLTDLSWLVYQNIFVIVKDADTFFSSFPNLRTELEEIFETAEIEQLEKKQVKLFLSDLHNF